MNNPAGLAKMRSRESNPPFATASSSVLRTGALAANPVRQILTFSRRDEPSQRCAIQLRNVVEETLKLLRVTFPASIEFKTFFAPDLPNVLANSSQIHRVLINLGTNAWQAMRDKAGQLEFRLENFEVSSHTVATQPRLRPGKYVRLSLTDSGCGKTDFATEPAFRPSSMTKGRGEGTRSGLSFVHDIIQSHDGVITVCSQPREGTTFHLYFPAHVDGQGKANQTAGPVPQGEGRSILYVDDEAALAQLGKLILEQFGYLVEAHTCPTKALDRVRADPQRFDLVITDQTMPGMSGTVFASHLQDVRPDLPIILISGYAPNLPADHLHALGIRKMLLKPQSIDSLATAVHAAIFAGNRRPD